MTATACPARLLTGALTVFLAVAATPATAAILRADRPIAEQYIVVLDDEVARMALSAAGPSVAQVAADLGGFYGVRVDRHYAAALAGFAFRGSAVAAEALARDPRIAYVAEDGWAEVSSVQTPIPSWGLDRIDQRPDSLDSQYTYFGNGTGIDLYVIDTGIRSTHQDFGGRVDTTDAFTAIADGNGTEDCNGHGTHVAGVAAGSTYGVAKGVTVHPVRVLDCGGQGPVSNIVAGVDWIAAHYTGTEPTRAVVNLSLRAGYSQALDQAVAASVALGITYVVAAGNDADDACYLSPGRLSQSITVGATDESGARWASSNTGTCVDLFAPGVLIYSAFNRADDDVVPMTGTSSAAPHVAGTAALVLAADPNLTPDEVQAAILAEATAEVVTDVGQGSPNLLLYSAFAGDGLQVEPTIFADGFENGWGMWGAIQPPPIGD